MDTSVMTSNPEAVSFYDATAKGYFIYVYVQSNNGQVTVCVCVCVCVCEPVCISS